MPQIFSPDNFLTEPDGSYIFTKERSTAAWKKTRKLVIEALVRPGTAGLTLLMGIPGAGKSTWMKEHGDHLRANVPDAVEEFESHVYVDATFIKPEWRAPFIEIAKAAGKPIHIVWLDTPLETCTARNSKRPEGRRVPEEVMEKMAEEMVAPRWDEGFNKVIHLTPDGVLITEQRYHPPRTLRNIMSELKTEFWHRLTSRINLKDLLMDVFHDYPFVETWTWEVWREDEQGRHFLVKKYNDQKTAERVARRMDKLSPYTRYWASEVNPDLPSDQEWEVWRQTENGETVLVGTYESRGDAEWAVGQLTRRGVHWAQPKATAELPLRIPSA